MDNGEINSLNHRSGEGGRLINCRAVVLYEKTPQPGMGLRCLRMCIFASFEEVSCFLQAAVVALECGEVVGAHASACES